MRLALYQPDIPQNTGTLIRLAACMDVQIDIIEPCGFPLSEKALRRAGMDYIDLAKLVRHASWEIFLETVAGARIVLLTTKSSDNFNDFAFNPQDILLLGRESAGSPEEVHARADARLTIPMNPDTRSLNIAISAAMVLGEALRQTNTFPTTEGAS